MGKEAAKYFAQNGCYVYATMRNPSKASADLLENANIEVLALDVEDQASIDACKKVVFAESGLDILVNNAGFGTFGTFEATTEEQIQNQFNVNVFGMMRVTQAFLPHFRENKAGTIINVSSMAGRAAFPLTSVYNASKFAVEGFSESLQYELEHLNVQVKIIEPGLINTNFAGSSMAWANHVNIDEYKSYSASVMRALMQSMVMASQPEDVAKVIYEASQDQSGKMRFVVGEDATKIIAKTGELKAEEFREYFAKEYDL